MNFKPILITNGEPNSVFLEIFLKAYKKKKFKSPLILNLRFNFFILNFKSS